MNAAGAEEYGWTPDEGRSRPTERADPGNGTAAAPVRARRLTNQEGQTMQRLVRWGRHDSVRVRRALVSMASASCGTPGREARRTSPLPHEAQDPRR